MDAKLIFLLASIFSGVLASDVEEVQKDGKLLPIFNIVNFPNDVCGSDTTGRNGTCYTSAECSNLGGSSSGSCAEGFGVCCVFELTTCGTRSSQNNSYIVLSSTTSPPDPCVYTICKCSNDVCRIRFDFTTFQIDGPVTGTVPSAVSTDGAAIGDCTTDSFSITGSPGTPVICGTNTGQHMIVDASDQCHDAAFDFGSTTNARLYNIEVTQYRCGEENERGGPPGCLQYHTATNGRITSFNFPTAGTVDASATHLSNQNYQICIRRDANMCYVCYIPVPITGTAAAINQEFFGLSDAMGNSKVGISCSTDYLEIPGGVDSTTVPNANTATVNQFCGRFLNTVDDQAASISVCSRSVPFRVGVVTDADEETIDGGTMEADAFPGGIIGFDLIYNQIPCA